MGFILNAINLPSCIPETRILNPVVEFVGGVDGEVAPRGFG